jgi:predicted nucleic acid-binding protein
VRTCFVDTWAYLALANRKDAGHAVAHEVDLFLDEEGWVRATSEWILDETLTQLHALAGASVATRFLDDLDAQLRSRSLLLLTVSPPRFEATVRKFRALAPSVPRLSLTDCSSFALMEELEIRWAFTADRHFYAAGPRIGPLVARDEGRLVFRAPIA